MRKLIVSEWMSLDGVVQAPSYPDEDRSSGFAHGGWHSSFFDDVSMRWVLQTVAAAGAYLLGRRTYEIFAAHWPYASPDERPLSEPLNSRRKYVASKTLREPLAWSNSSLLAGSVPSAVAALKGEDGRRSGHETKGEAKGCVPVASGCALFAAQRDVALVSSITHRLLVGGRRMAAGRRHGRG